MVLLYYRHSIFVKWVIFIPSHFLCPKPFSLLPCRLLDLGKIPEFYIPVAHNNPKIGQDSSQPRFPLPKKPPSHAVFLPFWANLLLPFAPCPIPPTTVSTWDAPSLSQAKQIRDSARHTKKSAPAGIASLKLQYPTCEYYLSSDHSVLRSSSRVARDNIHRWGM